MIKTLINRDQLKLEVRHKMVIKNGKYVPRLEQNRPEQTNIEPR